jgi:hypothetical protein
MITLNMIPLSRFHCTCLDVSAFPQDGPKSLQGQIKSHGGPPLV